MAAPVLPAAPETRVGEEGFDRSIDLLVEVGLVAPPEPFAVSVVDGREVGNVVTSGLNNLGTTQGDPGLGQRLDVWPDRVGVRSARRLNDAVKGGAHVPLVEQGHASSSFSQDLPSK